MNDLENDQRIAVRKRLIYAEDLFEPVDVKVLMVSKGGRSGGKTMAMYEQLFRKRVELAPTIDAVPVVRCKDCKHAYINSFAAATGTVLCCFWTNHGGGNLAVMQQDEFCSKGERRDNHGNL